MALALDGDKRVNKWLRKRVLAIRTEAKYGNIMDRARSNHYFCWLVNNHPVLRAMAKTLEVAKNDTWVRATFFEAVIGLIQEQIGHEAVHSFLSQTLLVAIQATTKPLQVQDRRAWRSILSHHSVPSFQRAEYLKTRLVSSGANAESLIFLPKIVKDQRHPALLTAMLDGRIVKTVRGATIENAWRRMESALASQFRVPLRHIERPSIHY